MHKVDLLKTDHIVKDTNLFIQITMSNVAKYTMDVQVQVELPLEGFLQFIENVLKHEQEPGGWEFEGDELSVRTTKTTAKIIHKDYYFSLKLKDIFAVVKQEIEKLYYLGIIEFNK